MEAGHHHRWQADFDALAQMELAYLRPLHARNALKRGYLSLAGRCQWLQMISE